MSKREQLLETPKADKFFNELAVRFGDAVGRKWPFESLLNDAKQTLEMDLSKLSNRQLHAGFRAIASEQFCPDVNRIVALCKEHGALDPLSAFNEAQKQLYNRRYGDDEWSHPAVYHAAIAYGDGFIHHSWDVAKTRYTKLLRQFEADCLPVPRNFKALPSPGNGTLNREQALQKLAELREKLGIKK